VDVVVPAALEHRVTLGWRAGAALLLAAGFVAAGCGAAAVNQVADGAYLSLVPSEDQFALDVDAALPGGVAHLREDAVDRVEVEISDDQVFFRIDGIDMATRNIVDRVDITDREGSGPFKAKKQILVLGDAPLVLGALIIDEPVIWPGSFEESPVITIKPRDPDERGPNVSCNTDEPCLLLSSGVDPAGSYADANNPELDENPIDSIVINDVSINITLDNGDQVTISASNGPVTRACGLSENHMWDLPPEIGLAINDPVLVHTLCPSTPGAAVQLVMMDRSAIPILAPLTDAREGDWCTPNAECLLFVPT
jgi:hypothetical protein